MTFSQNFQRICTERGTTRTDVLKSLGVSTSKVTLWANGSIPRPAMLQKLATALNCSVAEFFADEVPTPAAPSVTQATDSLSDDEAQIINIYRSLSRRERHLFMSKCYQFDHPSSTGPADAD